MSHDWVRWAREHATGSPADRHLLLLLASYADGDTGEAWPSRKTLANLTDLDESTVKRAIRRLEDAGLLTVVRGQFRGDHNTYFFGSEGSHQATLFATKGGRGAPLAGRKGGADVDERGAQGRTKGGHGAPRSVKERTVSVLNTHSRAVERVTPEVVPAPAPAGAVESEPKGFREFWSAWPRKVARSDAMRAFDRGVRRDGLDRVAAGLRGWAAYWQAEDTEQRYIPHAATWLNRSQYLDSPPAPHRPRDPTTEAIRARMRARGEIP
jgi:hypothetical protein